MIFLIDSNSNTEFLRTSRPTSGGKKKVKKAGEKDKTRKSK